MIQPKHDRALLPGTLQNLFYPPRRGEYTYFERARAVPFLTPEDTDPSPETPIGSQSVVKAAWAADTAMLAYARYGEQRMTEGELRENFRNGGLEIQTIGENGADWNAPGTQAIFAWSDEFAILAFRGTERDDFHDLISDADLIPRLEPEYRLNEKDPAPVPGVVHLLTHPFDRRCFVHGGFQKALDRVWPKVHAAVTNYRDQHPNAEVLFTGHSLGAALAVLGFGRFSGKEISLYTFGCPRIGDADFLNRVLSNQGRGIFRCVNLNDAVTHVPLKFLFFCHIPDACHRFDEEGNLGDSSSREEVSSLRAVLTNLPRGILPRNLDQIPAPSNIVDHSPARYCIRLWNCVP